ncbi:MAG TPA: apolipoprotein N-acyltransferase [Terrimicrobiaceae bacterium]
MATLGPTCFLSAAMKFYWPWLCAISSGALLALCFPPANLGGLCWFALTPLIVALWFSEPWKKRDALRLLTLGYLTGIVYMLGCLHWLVTVTVAGWISLCLFLGSYIALWSLFVGTVARPRQAAAETRPIWLKSSNNLRIAALAAAAWTALEWLRGVVFTGFGWNGLGIALHQNIALIQLCDITGVGGLSFLIVMVNLMIVITVKRLKTEIGREKLRPHYDFNLTVALVALVFGYGARQLFRPAPPGEPLSIAAVQGNVPVMEKRDPNQEERILDLHARLTQTALAIKPDLLIWPEAATPRPLFSDQRNWDVVRELAEKHAGDFLLGTVHSDDLGEYNSAILLTEGARNAQVYNKIHLVPFGEYVPLRNSFPLFAWIVGELVPDDFDFGKDPVILKMSKKPIRVAPLICFEDTLGDLTRQFALRGAQVLITMTNDGWFLKSAGSEQHAIHATFRCAETKLPMVRAANTGVSCVIDRFGRIVNRLQDDKGSTFIEGVLFAHLEVPKDPRQTFYTRYGEVFSLGCLLVSALACGLQLLRSKP